MVAAAVSVDARTRLRAPRQELRVSYEPRGAARELFFHSEPEVLIEGPAGTGKSLACLKKLDRNAIRYPGSRQLIVRKTRVSLTQTGMVTFEKQVIVPGGRVRFHTTLQAYLYPNGSIIGVGGLDKDSKIMSSEWDAIYVMEATELAETEVEALTTRLRNGVIPHQQLIMDCNPSSPKHWLNQRCNAGKTTRLISRHKDNPALWDQEREAWTKRGAAYMAVLDALTGVYRDRLRDGRWAIADGTVYDELQRDVHFIDRFDIPASWTRFWVIDFGFTHPFVWQAWAEDGDGRLYRYREVYMTGRLVEDHCQTIKRVTEGEPKPAEIITDHDAEDRATFERHIGRRTTPARKAVSPGIQAVKSRLKVAGDGKPRLCFLRGSLVERDPELADQKFPLCTEEEFDLYVWNTKQGQRKGEEPVKAFDHGMDAMRYLVMAREHDAPSSTPAVIPQGSRWVRPTSGGARPWSR